MDKHNSQTRDDLSELIAQALIRSRVLKGQKGQDHRAAAISAAPFVLEEIEKTHELVKRAPAPGHRTWEMSDG